MSLRAWARISQLAPEARVPMNLSACTWETDRTAIGTADIPDRLGMLHALRNGVTCNTCLVLLDQLEADGLIK